MALIVAFILGWLGAWALIRLLHQRDVEASQRRISSLMDRADRLAGEKVVLLTRLERHGENLFAIKQQLLARERALYAITGTWPVSPELAPNEP